MIEKINQLANGIVESEVAKLRVKPAYIDVQLMYGKENRLELEIQSLNHRYFKALAYTDDLRIKVLEPQFGGLRTKIHIKADDTCFLSKEDIEGNIYLVTNAGEITVPYVFRLGMTQTERLLKNLDSIDAFVKIAKVDYDTALRLFEYKDFTLAEFMKDTRLGAIYNALKKKDASALEEFLCACGIKERISLNFAKEKYVFAYNGTDKTFSIPIRKQSWGYCNFDVSCETDFIHLSQSSLSNEDFNKDTCYFNFEVLDKLPNSKHNKAVIIFSNAISRYKIEVELVSNQAKRDNVNNSYKKNISSYFNLRLQYEYEPDDIIPELMILELDELISKEVELKKYSFLKAEALCLLRRYKEAEEILERYKDSVVALKDEEVLDYVLFEYIVALMEDDDNVNHDFTKLLRRMINEGEYLLMPLLIKFDRRCKYKPSLVFELINEAFYAGSRSPFLYLVYIKFISENLDFLHDLTNLELQVFNFGLDRGILSKELVDEIVQRAKSIRKYSNLTYILFKKIYDKYKEDAYLEALCAVLIRGDIRTACVNEYFEKAIDNNLELFGIYEQYIYTLGKEKTGLFKEKILRYFLGDNALSPDYRALLYENVVLYAGRDAKIYEEYKALIFQFMLEQINAHAITKPLLSIYNEFIDADIVDSRLAKVLPDIVSAQMLKLEQEGIDKVIVVYPELKGENVYRYNSNLHYIPVYSKDAIVFVEDEDGIRYYVETDKTTLIKNKEEVLNRCYLIYPEHVVYKLAKLSSILAAGHVAAEDVTLIQRAAADNSLSDIYKANILSKLIDYLREDSKTPSGPDIWNVSNNHDFLLRASSDTHISVADRGKICDTLINLGYINESYQMIQMLGIEVISPDSARRLCNKLISDKSKYDPNVIKYLAFKVFRQGNYDINIMEYLCRSFNHCIKDMYELLERAVIDNVDTYDLEERVLIYMLFTGNLSSIDQVFAWYVSRKKTGVSIVKAYFAVKCVGYFIRDEKISAHVFERLEQSILSLDDYTSIPMIYQLAITKYYSELAVLDERQQKVVSDIIDNLMAYPIVFPYFKKLTKYVSLPQDIMDKEFLVYKSSSEKSPRLKSRVYPYDASFTEERFDYHYMNIYIKERLLFSGDRWEYMIYEEVEGQEKLTESSTIVHEEAIEALSFSRFDRINEIDILLNDDEADIYDENLIKDRLVKYLLDDEIARETFNLMM